MRGRRKQPPIPKPGEFGTLHFRGERDGGLVEHADDFRFVGQLVDGTLAFTPAVHPDDHPIYLAPDEVRSFQPREQT